MVLNITIFILIIFMTILLGGCTETTKNDSDEDVKSHQINFSIGHLGTIFPFDQDFENIVNTFTEWNAIPQLIELDAKYDEEFFVNNSLIIHAFVRGWSPVQTEITKVSRKGNELTVDVIHTEGNDAMMWYGIVIIEVAKKDIINVNSLRIECLVLFGR